MAKLEEIFQFAEVNEKLGTAGQPTREQFPAIKTAGYQVIINLATGQTERDIPDEADIVADLGLDYYHIPVDWENPTDDDLNQFFDLMEANNDKKIFVHCLANYRVSAFTMLYRVIKQGVPLLEAKAFKDTIWNPQHVYPKWDAFITNTLKQYDIEEK